MWRNALFCCKIILKPNHYESSRTKKYREQIGRAENMAYYGPEDYYLCKLGRMVVNAGTSTEHSRDGTTREVTRYRCEDCHGCPYRAACCKAKDPEQRKELVVCREFSDCREASQKRILSCGVSCKSAPPDRCLYGYGSGKQKLFRPIQSYAGKFAGYNDEKEDFRAYYIQHCESDARDYAKDAVRDYHTKIQHHFQPEP